jgi:putative tryptophan/tyrosine transport system substrate-binding protein
MQIEVFRVPLSGPTNLFNLIQAFKQELGKLGWTEGHAVQFDEHWTTGDMGLVRGHAAILMAAKPDVVVATGGRVIPILMQLSSSIPIVLPGGSDPVRVGYAKTLGTPRRERNRIYAFRSVDHG